MAIAKVVYYGNTLIDLTGLTVDAAHLLKNYTAKGSDGELVTGTCEYDADTSDANATAAMILAGSNESPITAYVNGTKITGTMPNNGGTGVTITTLTDVSIPQGYTDGSAKAGISSAEKAKIIPANIKQGVEILGVTGTMSGTEGVFATTSTFTPSTSAVTYQPTGTDPVSGESYNYFSSVTVAAVPYTTTQHSAGGTVVTIGS